MKILVLESSTASAKAMLYDTEKGIVKVTGKTYPAEVCDIVTQDADGMVEAVFAAGREAAAGEEIAAVALSGIWHSLLVCDSACRPKSKIYTWAYLGAVAQADAVRATAGLPQKIYQTTGCAVHAMYPLYKAMKLKEEGVIGRDDRIFHQGDYLYYRLTGEVLTSDCLASGSAMLNLKTKRFDGEMLELCGLTESMLPEVVDYTQTRPLSRAAADAMGVNAGVPVVTCHADGAMNQVGAGALRPGVMTFSVGTSGAIRLAVPEPVLPKNMGTWCYIAPGKYLSGAATNGACNCSDWFMKDVLQGTKTYREVEDAIELRLSNPYFLPFLFGERCPGWQDNRTGGFAGLTGAHKVPDMFYAILEGVLFNLYHCYGILTGIAGKAAEIKVSGGVLKSKLWSKMLVDIWQQPVTVSENEQASMLGAAALGAHAAGALADLADFGDPGERVMQPDPSMAEYYAKRFEKYLALYQQ